MAFVFGLKILVDKENVQMQLLVWELILLHILHVVVLSHLLNVLLMELIVYLLDCVHHTKSKDVIMELMASVFMLFKKDKLMELNNVGLNHVQITKIPRQKYANNIKRYVFQMVTIVS